MKTYQEFRNNIDDLDEGVFMTALGLGLAAHSAYSGIKNLRKGNYKGAAWDAVGMVPGGKAFKGIKALGGSKKLAKLGSFTQSSLRHGTDNAFSRATSNLYDPDFYKKGWTKGKQLLNKVKGKTPSPKTNAVPKINTTSKNKIKMPSTKFQGAL
tara:strand:- start:494 stop:955 length:462 start_codon:yes stop_codon:yes gene_type:complete